MTCEKCGVDVTGRWPFCPHPAKKAASHGVVGDDIPGGFVQENFGTTPEVFYSKKAMLARADELNLRQKDQWAGPGDRYLSNWASISPKTLEDARILLERVGQATGTKKATVNADFTIRPYES